MFMIFAVAEDASFAEGTDARAHAGQQPGINAVRVERMAAVGEDAQVLSLAEIFETDGAGWCVLARVARVLQVMMANGVPIQVALARVGGAF